jgi:hypothetical protein
MLTGRPLYLVIDAARREDLLDRLAALEEAVPIDCLWSGDSAVDYADVAPYLLPVPDSGEVDDFLAAGWGDSWGIAIATSLSQDDLRRHLRRYTMVRLPDGETLYLRLYDPRVLRTMLPTLTREQVGPLFAGVDAMIAEGATPGLTHVFTAEDGILSRFDIGGPDGDSAPGTHLLPDGTEGVLWP